MHAEPKRRPRISNKHQPIVTIDYLSDRDGLPVAPAIAPRCSDQLRLHGGELDD